MTGQEAMSVGDALIYLENVKKEFHRQPHVYEQFVSLMSRFKRGQVEEKFVIQEVVRLFRGRDELIMGFNRFLPEDQRVNLEKIRAVEKQLSAQEGGEGTTGAGAGAGAGSDPTKQENGKRTKSEEDQRHIGEALVYLDQVKLTFSDRMEVYSEFLEIMRQSKDGEIDTPSLINKVGWLFHGYPTLIMGFNTFLPDEHKISENQMEEMQKQNAARGHPAERSGMEDRPARDYEVAKDYSSEIKRRFANESRQETYRAFLKLMARYDEDQGDEQIRLSNVLHGVAELFANHHDLLRSFIYFLPHSQQGYARQWIEAYIRALQ